MSTTLDSLMNSKPAMIALAFIAFLLAAVLVLIIVRMLIGGRLRMPGGRARQARLGIVDAFDLDRQRQLIIIRRDNTEHLIMIGGPNDILIESEIVRVEARDFRDARRDKSVDPFVPGAGEPRIPAPFTSNDVVLPTTDGAPTGSPSRPLPEEPILPIPTRETPPEPADAPPVLEPSAPAQRTPTFPLPPRRPPAPERRVPSPPEGVSRTEPALSPPPLMVPAEVTDPSPELPAAPAEPIQAIEGLPPQPPPPAPQRPVPSVRPPPPPFLKPLPPRPPIRPLRRATPQVPTTFTPVVRQPGVTPQPQTGEAASEGTTLPAPSVEPVQAQAAAPQAAPAPPPTPHPAPESKDALESLEEEMAKLLGRGG